MSTQPPDTPALLQRLDRHLTNPQRRALVEWAAALLRIRRTDASPLRKAKLALDLTYRAEVVVPILDGAAHAIVDVAWRDRTWAARLGLGAAALAVLLSGGQGAGIAALGGAIGVPLWIVLGGGGAFAGMLVDELQRSLARHGGHGTPGAHPGIEDAEWELLPGPGVRLPAPAGESAPEPQGREPLWRVFRRAYRQARDRQAHPGTLHLEHPSGSRAVVHLHGAHVTSWTDPAGREALFLSRYARFGPGAAIRGGIPVVFPQFANRGPLPKHGFARTTPWEPVEQGTDAQGAAFALLRLEDTAGTRALWPHPFRAELRVALDEALTLTLRVRNTGSAPFEFTCALHTYLRVGDVEEATVEGLRGVRYLDKVEGGEERVETRDALDFRGETDRVYLRAPDRLRVRDGASGRTVAVEKEGFTDAVVWNPWAEKARELEDMGAEEYREMLCVEPARVGDPIRLEPGAEWSGTARLRVEG